MERYIFSNEARAQVCLDQLNELIEIYGVATRADLKSIYGLIPNELDKKYGWIDLSGASIAAGPLENEVTLELPRSFRIE